MLQFLSASWGTILIGAVVAAIVVLIVLKMCRDKKQGKSSCGCGCADCPASGSCHGQNGSSQQKK